MLEPFTGTIDRTLEDDLKVPWKQRHTAKRIYERLWEEHGFAGQYTIVKDYARERRRQSRELFAPLFHSPGHAQCDFGEAWVIIGGVEQKAHYFVLDLPHSDGCFVKAYPAETTEAFLDGPVSAFAFLDGMPQSIVYDNTRLAVAKTAGESARGPSPSFGPTTCSMTGSADRASNCVGSQAIWGFQGVPCRSMALRTVSSLCIHAVSATFGGLPAFTSRS